MGLAWPQGTAFLLPAALDCTLALGWVHRVTQPALPPWDPSWTEGQTLSITGGLVQGQVGPSPVGPLYAGRCRVLPVLAACRGVHNCQGYGDRCEDHPSPPRAALSVLCPQ